MAANVSLIIVTRLKRRVIETFIIAIFTCTGYSGSRENIANPSNRLNRSRENIADHGYPYSGSRENITAPTNRSRSRENIADQGYTS
jgi:hypothetical protein